MEWLINLIFSNLLILILIYVIVRALFRSNPQQRGQMHLPRQIPSVRPSDTMEVKKSEFTTSPAQNTAELINEHKGELKEKKRAQANIQPKMDSSITDSSDILSTPAEGMMWSEIFGPPVSKRSRR